MKKRNYDPLVNICTGGKWYAIRRSKLVELMKNCDIITKDKCSEPVVRLDNEILSYLLHKDEINTQEVKEILTRRKRRIDEDEQ